MARKRGPKHKDGHGLVKKTIQHDRMVIEASYPSGGMFRVTISRTGERFVMGGSSDPVENQRQLDVLTRYFEFRGNEDNQGRIDRLGNLAEQATSISELVDLMETN
jgi:hypothetical protein